MPRRSRGGFRGRQSRPEYRWAGFYHGPTALTLAVTNSHITLFSPLEFENNVENDVTCVRVRAGISMLSILAGTNATMGAMIHIAEVNQAEAIVSEVDPLGTTTDDIKRNSQLWMQQRFLPQLDVDGPAPHTYLDIDVKVNRRIQAPRGLFLTLTAAAASSVQVHVWARCLLRTGRR